MLQPLVYGRTVQLSPLLVLIAVLIGAELAGILGALLAIPTAGSPAYRVKILLAQREALSRAPDSVVGRRRGCRTSPASRKTFSQMISVATSAAAVVVIRRLTSDPISERSRTKSTSGTSANGIPNDSTTWLTISARRG